VCLYPYGGSRCAGAARQHESWSEGRFWDRLALSARSLTIPLLLYSYGTETLTIALLYYYEEGYRNITAVIAMIQLGLVMGLLILERLTRPRQSS
jgi:ABC-type Fe3+ transport system permease subunit